jgi:hypothetical protein
MRSDKFYQRSALIGMFTKRNYLSFLMILGSYIDLREKLFPASSISYICKSVCFDYIDIILMAKVNSMESFTSSTFLKGGALG